MNILRLELVWSADRASSLHVWEGHTAKKCQTRADERGRVQRYASDGTGLRLLEETER